MKKNIKIIVFIISIVGFSDFFINPRSIWNLNTKWNFLLSLLIAVCLSILVLREILKDKIKISDKLLTVVKVMVLILLLIYLNVLLKQFNFIQKTEYVIIAILTLPVPWILNELLVENINVRYLAIGGVFFLATTLSYFEFVYEPYEAYSSNGMPIVFVHQRIRNWLCYIGVIMIVISILRIKINSIKKK